MVYRSSTVILALLAEARQHIPDFLTELEPDQPELLGDGDERGCKFCGGLGHRITDCPKLESAQARFSHFLIVFFFVKLCFYSMNSL